MYERNGDMVHIDDGYMQTSRKFDPDIDGWMDEQLTEKDLPSVRMAEDIISLFHEVNSLRKENWLLRKRLNTRKGY